MILLNKLKDTLNERAVEKELNRANDHRHFGCPGEPKPLSARAQQYLYDKKTSNIADEMVREYSRQRTDADGDHIIWKGGFDNMRLWETGKKQFDEAAELAASKVGGTLQVHTGKGGLRGVPGLGRRDPDFDYCPTEITYTVKK